MNRPRPLAPLAPRPRHAPAAGLGDRVGVQLRGLPPGALVRVGAELPVPVTPEADGFVPVPEGGATLEVEAGAETRSARLTLLAPPARALDYEHLPTVLRDGEGVAPQGLARVALLYLSPLDAVRSAQGPLEVHWTLGLEDGKPTALAEVLLEPGPAKLAVESPDGTLRTASLRLPPGALLDLNVRRMTVARRPSEPTPAPTPSPTPGSSASPTASPRPSAPPTPGPSSAPTARPVAMATRPAGGRGVVALAALGLAALGLAALYGAEGL